VPGVRFVYFNDQDVVRHQLVSAIIRAYDAHDARAAALASPASEPPPAGAPAG
jgi:phosphate starvation-inducible protein PhoH